MIVETNDPVTTPIAELLKGLLDAGKLNNFRQKVDDKHVPWHCICLFEEDLLAFEQRNPFCGVTDGWQIVVGDARSRDTYTMPDVPTYVGYGRVQAWLEHDGDVAATIEPGYGILLWGIDEFFERFDASRIASVPLADDSGMQLNAVMREIVERSNAAIAELEAML